MNCINKDFEFFIMKFWIFMIRILIFMIFHNKGFELTNATSAARLQMKMLYRKHRSMGIAGGRSGWRLVLGVRCSRLHPGSLCICSFLGLSWIGWLWALWMVADGTALCARSLVASWVAVRPPIVSPAGKKRSAAWCPGVARLANLWRKVPRCLKCFFVSSVAAFLTT